MREIRFRAWEEETEMGKPGNMSYNQEFCMAMILHPDSGITVMQFTGLHDKNGKQIYEGDVVLVGNSYTAKAQVIYQAPSFVMKEDPSHKIWYDFVLAPTENQFCEIIGNIYEGEQKEVTK